MLEIIGYIVKGVGTISKFFLELNVKKHERDTAELKSKTDLEVSKILGPAQMAAADEKTKQAVLKLAGAKIQADTPPVNYGPWILLFLILVAMGGGFIYFNNGSTDNTDNTK